jgi:ketosteroid isomerase-like protein
MAQLTPSPSFDFERGRNDDRFAITELLHRYAYYFDRNEPEHVAALFTDDAVIDYGPEFPAIHGRAAVAERIGPGLRTIFAATSHHISNVIIDFEGADDARVTAYVYAWHRYLDGSPNGHLWGQYHVRARRSSGAWGIAALKLRVVAVEDFHRTNMHPIDRRGTSAG